MTSGAKHLVLAAGLSFLVWAPARARAQDGHPQCPSAERHRFDFLIGDWHGQEYSFPSGQRDSIKGDGAVAHNRQTADCEFEEHVVFTPPHAAPIRATVLRVFDRAGNRWMYGLIDGFLELAVFPGTLTDSGWVFSHDLPTMSPPRRIHTSWVQTPSGYTEIMHTSLDSGRTWPILYHAHFERDRKP